MATLESVLHDHGPMLARVVASYEADAAWREDLMQDICLALWKALPTFRGDSGLRTFVARIAHNRAVDHILRQKRVREHGAFDAQAMVAGASAADQALDQRMDLTAALRTLPIGYRQVMVLVLEGFRHREIADVLGLDENTVAQRASRGRQRLRQHFDSENHNEQ